MISQINHILFPTDFSNNSNQVLPLAAEIAVRTDAKLTLFHARQQTMDTAPDFEKSKEQILKDPAKYFDELITQLRENKQHKDLTLSTIYQDGQTVKTILNHAKNNDVDLIVMGNKGVTGNRKILWGSTTSRVIQKADIPILTIPKSSTLNNFNHIIFTTDFKESDPIALQETASLATLFNAVLDVLHISDQKDLKAEIQFRGFREFIKEHIEYDKLNFLHKYDLDFFPSVAEYILENPASMLSMVRYKKSFWKKIAQRNHSKEMSAYSKVPLLMIPGKENVHWQSIIDNN